MRELTWPEACAAVALALFCTGCGPKPGAFPEPVQTVDLASDTEWEIQVDGGSWRPIKVPFGGYNSDLQDTPLILQTNVRESATYRRRIRIPESAQGRVVKLAFGAVNHGCEVLVDGQNAGSHVGPLMPFELDISNLVRPGGTHELRVVSHPQWFYNFEVPHGFIYSEAREHPNTRVDFSEEPGWASKFGYGITRFVELRIYPDVHIEDLFVRPSVSSGSLAIDLWIHNGSPRERTLEVESQLTSWNGDAWQYPRIGPVQLTVPAGETRQASAGPVLWGLGPESYWWPNKPFREDYQAQLHNLTVTLSDGGSLIASKTQRFGFVEWGEGPNYFTVNGVRINQISDGTPESAMSDYDCYTECAAFLPPTETRQGCPESWKRFMRLGISANRTHQSTPTEYMMDAADEAGFMLIPETAIRGCQTQNWHDDYLPAAARELARTCRNHPSVSRYSLFNESQSAEEARVWTEKLIEAIVDVDPTRPLVFEDNRIREPVRITTAKGHAHAMLHYADYPRPAEILTGMGEFAWQWDQHNPQIRHASGGLEEFIYYGGDMRRWDIAYIAGWDFLNYWPNFLEGMSSAKHAWKQSAYPRDRIDGIDGWGSPVVRWALRYFHPYLVLDLGVHEMNQPGADPSRWPEFTSSYSPGSPITRQLEVFNDGLQGSSFVIQWEARWDSAEGPLVESGNLEGLSIEPGFHRTVQLGLKAPPTDRNRKLFLVLRSLLEDREVFSEKELYFQIAN